VNHIIFISIFWFNVYQGIHQQPTNCASSVDNILFTANDVREKIDKLKPGSSPGPDNINTKILQDFSNILASPLAMIYNNSN